MISVESLSTKPSKSNGSVFCHFGPNSAGSLSKKRELIIDANEGKMEKTVFLNCQNYI